MPIGFLLALQASGMVVDWLGKNEQVRMSKMGEQVEQAGIAANIQTARLQAEDESLQSMKALRQNLGTQAALFAARGTAAGAGTAVLSANESISNFNADQRMRKLNEQGNEARIKAGGVLSSLHETAFENKTWNDFTRNVINKIPTSGSAYKQIANGFSSKNGYGFGLTSV